MRIVKSLTSFGLALSVAFAAATGAASAAETIKVGVTPGTHEQVFEFVKPLLKEKGLDIQIVTFNDYILPNQALDAGDLQVNSFQHKPYLDSQIKDRGYKLAIAGTNFIEPFGLYSQKIKKLDELKEGASIAIPNDPSNGGRALLLLAKKGVIELDPSKGITPSVRDITKNPKKIKFKELDAAQLPRVLPDVDAAAINTNYALEAKLNPLKDAIAIEDSDSPYANIFVVREQDKDAPWVKTLVETYRSEKVKAFILDTFKGAVVPTF